MSRPISVLLTAAALFMLSAFPAAASPMLSGKDTLDHFPINARLFPIPNASVEVYIVTWQEDKTGEKVDTYQTGGWDGIIRVFLAEMRLRSFGDGEPYEIWMDSCLVHEEDPCGSGELLSLTTRASAEELIISYFQKQASAESK